MDPSPGHEVVELPQPEIPVGQLQGEMEKIRDEDVRMAIERILRRRGIHPKEEG